MFSDSTQQIVTKSTVVLTIVAYQCLCLSWLLYPLERFQSIQQIQNTYSNPQIKSNPDIITYSSHFGIRNVFRGFVTFAGRTALITTSMQISNSLTKTDIGQPIPNNTPEPKQYFKKGIGLAVSSCVYALLYPFELVQIRMLAQLGRERFYTNARECLWKMRKNEGAKSLFRGFSLGYVNFISQVFFVKEMISLMEDYRSKADGNEGKVSGLLEGGKLLGLYLGVQLLLHPLNTVKKIYQINGSLGHIDHNYNIRTAYKSNSFTDLYRGIGIRFTNLLLYASVYIYYFSSQSNHL